MRESQIEGGFARCSYTDTDYLLAAQAAAAEVITSYASIDGMNLEAELRIPTQNAADRPCVPYGERQADCN